MDVTCPSCAKVSPNYPKSCPGCGHRWLNVDDEALTAWLSEHKERKSRLARLDAALEEARQFAPLFEQEPLALDTALRPLPFQAQLRLDPKGQLRLPLEAPVPVKSEIRWSPVRDLDLRIPSTRSRFAEEMAHIRKYPSRPDPVSRGTSSVYWMFGFAAALVVVFFIANSIS